MSAVAIIPLNQGFLVFTADTDEDLARRTFKSRFGYDAEQIIKNNRHIFLGPVKEEQDEHQIDVSNMG